MSDERIRYIREGEVERYGHAVPPRQVLPHEVRAKQGPAEERGYVPPKAPVPPPPKPQSGGGGDTSGGNK